MNSVIGTVIKNKQFTVTNKLLGLHFMNPDEKVFLMIDEYDETIKLNMI